MTTKQTEQRFAQTWELDSILPHPDTPAFGETLGKFKTDLAGLADDSDKLPPVAANSSASGKWGEFLQRYEKVASTASDLSSFVSCHAAADAENKRFQQLEGVLRRSSRTRNGSPRTSIWRSAKSIRPRSIGLRRGIRRWPRARSF